MLPAACLCTFASDTIHPLLQVADDFVARESGAAVGGARDEAFARDMQKMFATEREQLVAKLSAKVDMTSREEKQAEIKKSAFWLPAHAPGHQHVKVQKPPRRPPSPISGKPLRLADLVSIDLRRTNDEPTGRPLCAISQKEINFSEAVAITTSGQVMLREHFDKMGIAKNLVCPVTGKSFELKDILHLRKAASGKAASGSVVARHWTPGMK